MSFASEPGRDDGSLPPVHIVIPDDARELDRDVLAYRREQRAMRRRQRIAALFGPLRRHGFGGQAAILPLIATCLALSMLAGAMLSVVTISPASAPTLSRPPQATSGPASPAGSASPASRPPAPASLEPGPTGLPSGTVTIANRAVPVRSLASSALALIPVGCGCGAVLRRLAGQAAAAHVGLYFVASGAAMPQLASLTTQYGGGTAKAAYDTGNVLGAAYHPAGLTVLLVYSDATAQVRTGLPAGFQLTPVLRGLRHPGA